MVSIGSRFTAKQPLVPIHDRMVTHDAADPGVTIALTAPPITSIAAGQPANGIVWVPCTEADVAHMQFVGTGADDATGKVNLFLAFGGRSNPYEPSEKLGMDAPTVAIVAAIDLTLGGAIAPASTPSARLSASDVRFADTLSVTDYAPSSGIKVFGDAPDAIANIHFDKLGATHIGLQFSVHDTLTATGLCALLRQI